MAHVVPYLLRPNLIISRPLLDREIERRIGCEPRGDAIALELTIAGLGGNEMDLMRLNKCVEARIKQTVCRRHDMLRAD